MVLQEVSWASHAIQGSYVARDQVADVRSEHF